MYGLNFQMLESTDIYMVVDPPPPEKDIKIYENDDYFVQPWWINIYYIFKLVRHLYGKNMTQTKQHSI